MTTRSLRLRLTLAAAVATALALAVIAGLLISGFNRHLMTRTQEELAHQLDQLASLFILDEQGRPQLEADLSDPRYERPLSGLYWQIGGSAGARLRSRSLWDTVLETSPASGGNVALETAAGPGGAPVLVLSRDVTLRDGAGTKQQFRLSVALDKGEIDRTREGTLRPILIGLALAGLALVASAWAQVGFGLKPLEAMRRELERVRMGGARQLHLGAFPPEIRPLGEEINSLLEGHHALVERARRRAGDLAHGLKTPLAALTAQADLLAESGNHAKAAALRKQIMAMQMHVERELTLARSQGGGLAPGISTHPVKELEQAIDVLKKLPAARPLSWSVCGKPEIAIAMAGDDFAEVAGNLLDNARKWARSHVTASVVAQGERVRISIEDDGPGIEPEVRATCLKRGMRLDETVPGTGLGLSIVASILESYGIELRLEEAEGGGLTAHFDVPTLHSAPAQARSPKAA